MGTLFRLNKSTGCFVYLCLDCGCGLDFCISLGLLFGFWLFLANRSSLDSFLYFCFDSSLRFWFYFQLYLCFRLLLDSRNRLLRRFCISIGSGCRLLLSGLTLLHFLLLVSQLSLWLLLTFFVVTLLSCLILIICLLLLGLQCRLYGAQPFKALRLWLLNGTMGHMYCECCHG